MKILSRPIKMISWTDKDGTIYPIRFQIEDEHKEARAYKILKIYKTDTEKLAGNIMYKYTCEIALNGIKKLCEIKYEKDSCRWILFKI